ncbi:hypothetical protein ISF_02277 [Cordyceps fumosorosea ARSEF 2679]|uniref:Uncharacterized protein n=1 Tax=Cordyceps fumosorosea (strain ARSEF 2679) TaxID=1081104 RepID=A0A168BM96_CORFA|nr:hypothetical protein ISF_02277 [Cordyceps fumosorosea ARSEF 2679]OAA70303.1 hypothetical protein ISF_02277 [Cordyceps fumosorosea ARSEF 2679]
MPTIKQILAIIEYHKDLSESQQREHTEHGYHQAKSHMREILYFINQYQVPDKEGLRKYAEEQIKRCDEKLKEIKGKGKLRKVIDKFCANTN